MNGNKRTTSKKLLVCAPSNAAVDELVMRFKEGVKTTTGQVKKLNIVRLGRSDAINSNVTDVTLEKLVNARLSGNNGQDENHREETQKLFQEHKEVSGRLNEARDRLNAEQAKGLEAKEAKAEFEVLRRRKTELSKKIDETRDKENQKSRTADLERKRVQQAILDEAHIICGTLSGSGHDMFQKLDIEFETVIVDEAAQCVEMSVLIPLKYGCAKCILVGDPKQLPPTVFSREAAKYQYEQSLFVRMQANRPEDVHLLDTQYRMHPEISLFPSKSFYDGKLLDGPDMARLRIQPWHKEALLGPYRFFDVQGQHQAASKGHSLINIAEIDVALQLVEKLTAAAPTYDFKGKIGIITPYKSQLRELKERFSRRYGKSIVDSIEFNTTDAFQGRESEVIIFSCVRAAPSGGVGFLSDIRRMNVGLTRAKSSLWVLGNSESLMRGEFWRKFIDDAKARDRHSPSKSISSMNGSKTSMAALMNNDSPSVPKVMSSVPIRMDSSKDVVMSNSGSSSNSVASAKSRQSSIESTASSKKSVKSEIPHLDVKQEPPFKREFSEDVEMKDFLSDDDDTPPKEENRIIKEENQMIKKENQLIKEENQLIKEEKKLIKEEKKPIAPVQQLEQRPSTMKSGTSVPGPPAAPGIKRRKAPANPLMQQNRPKKPKTE
jgi:senataxin